MKTKSSDNTTPARTSERSRVERPIGLAPRRSHASGARPGLVFTGQATFTIRGYRLFDNKLQVTIEVDNQASADAKVNFDSYVANGQQYSEGYDGNVATATKPTV